jgi:hypothetical protein
VFGVFIFEVKELCSLACEKEIEGVKKLMATRAMSIMLNFLLLMN